jgi:hypothetical protein
VAAQEATAQTLFPDSRAAYEGLEVKLKGDPKGFYVGTIDRQMKPLGSLERK